MRNRVAKNRQKGVLTKRCSIMRSFLGASLSVVVLLLGPTRARAQDSASWVEEVKSFCANPSPQAASDLRRTVASAEKSGIRQVLTAIRSILLWAEVEEWRKPNQTLKALARYLDAVGSSLGPGLDDQKGLAAALDAGSDSGRLLAMAHLDRLLESGSTLAGLDGILKKLGVSHEGDEYVSKEAEEIAAIKRMIDAGSGGVLARERAGSPEAKYLKAYGLLKALEKQPDLVEPARSALSSAKRLAKDHVKALLQAMEPFGRCRSCKGKRVVTCAMCKGKGEVEVVCPHCGGKGILKIDELKGSDTVRGRKKGQGVVGRTPKGEIVSLKDDETICPTCVYDHRKEKKKCQFCNGTGKVQCQRCRWSKPRLESIADVEPCKNCSGSGYAFSTIRYPCAFCKGLGVFLLPKGDSSKTIGPLE